MTNNQKENLLKLLLNKPKDDPNENVPSYSDVITYDNDIGTKATTIFGSPIFATPYRTLGKDNITISYNNECIIINDNVVNTQYWHLYDLFQDDVGFYGIVYHDNKIWLSYFDDITQVSQNGIKTKIEYDITSMLTEVTGDTNPADHTFEGTIKINKSPIDGRFLIATSLTNQTYFAVIEYTINVGSNNEYRYQRIAKSSLTTNNPRIDDMYVSWIERNVQYAIGIISSSSEPQQKTNLTLYEITGTMDTIANSIISNLSGVLNAPGGLYVNYTPQIRYRTLTDRFYSYSTIKNTSHTEGGVTWYEGDVVLSRLNGDTRTELSRTTTQYMYTNKAFKNEADIIVLNDNVFCIETILTSPSTIQATFKQLIGNEIHGKVVLDNVSYPGDDSLGFTQITNEFNLYKYSYQLNDNLYVINSVFRPSGYNGVPYFSNKSLSPQSGQLYDITSEVVFARDLYNKTIIGDTINSIIHVPSNYLNEKPIMEEMLISYTNEAIDDVDEEIEKNEYEELYINFVDTYKVWDMNNKKTYQQRASYETATQLNEGFEMYVGTFRITYNDNTTKESSLGDIPIVDGEGVIEIYFEVKQVGAKTLEILDQNYDIVFATIDLSSLQPGAYKITEKVKVEG